jgi:hypothetical protein
VGFSLTHLETRNISIQTDRRRAPDTTVEAQLFILLGYQVVNALRRRRRGEHSLLINMVVINGVQVT